jgi:hypothetical protein
MRELTLKETEQVSGGLFMELLALLYIVGLVGWSSWEP